MHDFLQKINEIVRKLRTASESLLLTRLAKVFNMLHCVAAGEKAEKAFYCTLIPLRYLA